MSRRIYNKRVKKTKTKRTRPKITYKKTRTKRYRKIGGVYIDPNYGITNPYPFVDPHD